MMGASDSREQGVEPATFDVSMDEWLSDHLDTADRETGDWEYPALAEPVAEETCHIYLPYWVIKKGKSTSGNLRIHIPREGASLSGPEPMCGTAICDEAQWEGRRIPVFPPPAYHPICDRCLSRLADKLA